MLAATTYWRSAAACRSCDPDLFFPVSSSERAVEQVAKAKEICARCPVQPECLAFALRTRQVHGVWGGMSEEERFRLWRADEQGIDRGAGERHLHSLQEDENLASECVAAQR